MTQSLYQLLTDEDVRRDEAAILRRLTAIAAEKRANEVKLLNYYKEVPITTGASIESVDRGVVEMTVNKLQAAAMLKQKMTFIKSPHLAHNVTAKVERVQMDKNRVFLSQFSYAAIRAERRKSARVKINAKREATFRVGKVMLTGLIRDISIGGVSIITPKGVIFPPNVKGTVSLSLGLLSKIFLPARLIRVDDDDSGSNFFAFEMEMDAKNEKILTKFIFEQQRIILTELKDTL
jgi:c-di-GMP-binding flagellar brake protein YcgR